MLLSLNQTIPPSQTNYKLKIQMKPNQEKSRHSNIYVYFLGHQNIYITTSTLFQN